MSDEVDFTKDFSGRLYKQPDAEFITEFALENAVRVTPVAETPWCGSFKLFDESVLNPRELTKSSTEALRREKLLKGESRGYTNGDLSGKSRYRITHVETPEFNAYVFNFIDTGTPEYNGWLNRVITSCKFGMWLGMHIPAVVFGESWMAVQAPDESIVTDGRNNRMTLQQAVRDGFPIEPLLLDVIRGVIIGHGNGRTDSIVMTQDGEFSIGSLEFTGFTVHDQAFRFVYNLCNSVQSVTQSSRLYNTVVRLLVGLIEWIVESGLPEPYKGTHIEANLESIPDIVDMSVSFSGRSLSSDGVFQTAVTSAGEQITPDPSGVSSDLGIDRR